MHTSLHWGQRQLSCSVKPKSLEETIPHIHIHQSWCQPLREHLCLIQQQIYDETVRLSSVKLLELVFVLLSRHHIENTVWKEMGDSLFLKDLRIFLAGCTKGELAEVISLCHQFI